MTMSEQVDEPPPDDWAQEGPWNPWPVAPGFEVRSEWLGLVQVNRKEFAVMSDFRYSHDEGKERLAARVAKLHKLDDQAARAMVESASLFKSPRDGETELVETDLASIPPFVRWFENSYGLHTPAAIIHDGLIQPTRDSGALQSDALADFMFWEMMRSAGVPWLKRSIMWAAVSLRTRWKRGVSAAGLAKKAGVILWLILACSGIVSFVWSLGSSVLEWGHPVPLWAMYVYWALGWIAAAVLWGRQWRAGLVGGLAALWILPPAVLAGVGGLFYLAFEGVLRRDRRWIAASLLAVAAISVGAIWLDIAT
ncbi:DUF1353 domain-containing protein [Desertimonas flava]|uniref:DUF1353 domain-containing protein n=1 Tax=Desertimonas flava TaxID=2064846 RepID=UPI000E341DC5|nr:DUF1353 domain-containing protein [Desertimonas flava]